MKILLFKGRWIRSIYFHGFSSITLTTDSIKNAIITCQAEYMSVSQECDSTENADNILHEDKLVIVQPAASQFWIFACPNIPARLAKSGCLVSARKTQADRTVVDHYAQITWTVTNNCEVKGISVN